MTNREKKLIWYSLIILLAYLIPFEGVPKIVAFEQEINKENLTLEKKIAKLNQLISEHAKWNQVNLQNIEKKKTLDATLLSGTTQDLIGARLQGTLQKLADRHNIKLTSIALPQFHTRQGWLFTSQTIQFRSSSNRLLQFLNAIDSNQVKLLITEINIRANKKTLTGSFTVIGFSKD